MMYITYEDGTDEVWHVGNGRITPAETVTRVVHVQADGHELEYIEEHFTNLPTAPKKRVVRYYGDHARFIAGNLK